MCTIDEEEHKREEKIHSIEISRNSSWVTVVTLGSICTKQWNASYAYEIKQGELQDITKI